VAEGGGLSGRLARRQLPRTCMVWAGPMFREALATFSISTVFSPGGRPCRGGAAPPCWVVCVWGGHGEPASRCSAPVGAGGGRKGGRGAARAVLPTLRSSLVVTLVTFRAAASLTSARKAAAQQPGQWRAGAGGGALGSLSGGGRRRLGRGGRGARQWMGQCLHTCYILVKHSAP